jgi:NADH dehydrogenase
MNVIWAAGVTGNLLDGSNPTSVMNNRYIIDRFNKVEGYENIYAIGDVSLMKTPKFPNGHPQLANVAIN